MIFDFLCSTKPQQPVSYFWVREKYGILAISWGGDWIHQTVFPSKYSVIIGSSRSGKARTGSEKSSSINFVDINILFGEGVAILMQ